MRRLRGRSGQASVELVALLPVLVAFAIGGWQLVRVAQGVWLAGTAARAAARAQAVGADPRHAARAVLPAAFERRLAVDASRGGGVRVALRVPVAGLGRSLVVRARAALPDQAR